MLMGFGQERYHHFVGEQQTFFRPNKGRLQEINTQMTHL